MSKDVSLQEMVEQDPQAMPLDMIKAVARSLWHDEWVAQGSEDMGTCCGGKGIAKVGCNRNFIDFNWSQGNLGAQRTNGPVLDWLNGLGIGEFYYNDGWMD